MDSFLIVSFVIGLIAVVVIFLAGCFFLYYAWRSRYVETHYKNYRKVYNPSLTKYIYRVFFGPTLFKRRRSEKYRNYFFEDKVIGKPVDLFVQTYYGIAYVKLDFEYDNPRKVIETYACDHMGMMKKFEQRIRDLFYEKMDSGRGWTADQAMKDIGKLLDKYYGDIFENGIVTVRRVKLKYF